MNSFEWNENIRPCQPHLMEEPSEESHFDFAGAIHLEDSLGIDSPELYDLLGIDGDRWTIVAINALPRSGEWVDSNLTDDDIRVYAVDEQGPPLEQRESGGVGKPRGHFEVVEFYVHHLSFADVLRTMKSTSISVKAREFRDQQFYVTGKAEIDNENNF